MTTTGPPWQGYGEEERRNNLMENFNREG
jgi:hypothetical protein